MTIDPETQALTDFAQDGVVCIRSAIDLRWLDKLRDATERGLRTSENYFRRHTLWQDEPIFEKFCFESQAPKLASQLLQTRKLNLLYDQIFVKEPGSGTATPWHNDQPYWPVRGSRVATVWVALDAITKESGAMEFIKGSHRWNRWFQPFLSATDGGVDTVYERSIEFEPLPDFDAHRAQLHILCFDMQPGDAIVFHALTVHGARANVAQRRRRGYAIRYTGDDVTYFEGPGTNPRLLNSALVAGHAIDSEEFPVVMNSEDVSR